MRIACDVDGVLADLLGEWLRRYNTDWHDTLDPAAVTGSNLRTLVKPECGHGIFSYLHAPDLYDHIQPVEGAVEGVAALRAAGHKVLFVTKNAWGMTDPKAQWLVRHGFCADSRPHLPVDLIVTGQKTLIGADVLIDDHRTTIRHWTERTGRPGILFGPGRPPGSYALHAVTWRALLQLSPFRTAPSTEEDQHRHATSTHPPASGAGRRV